MHWESIICGCWMHVVVEEIHLWEWITCLWPSFEGPWIVTEVLGHAYVFRSKRVLKKTGQCFVLNGIAFLGRCRPLNPKSVIVRIFVLSSFSFSPVHSLCSNIHMFLSGTCSPLSACLSFLHLRGCIWVTCPVASFLGAMSLRWVGTLLKLEWILETNRIRGIKILDYVWSGMTRGWRLELRFYCSTQRGLILSSCCQHFDTTEGRVTGFALAAERPAGLRIEQLFLWIFGEFHYWLLLCKCHIRGSRGSFLHRLLFTCTSQCYLRCIESSYVPPFVYLSLCVDFSHVICFYCETKSIGHMNFC